MLWILTILQDGMLLAAAPVPSEVKGAYWLLLLVCGLFVAVFALTLLLIRSLRRYRQTYMTSPHKPTPNEDIWQKHRLPEGWEKQIEPDQPDKDKPC